MAESTSTSIRDRVWHTAYVRWHNHRDEGHSHRAAIWGVVADTIIRIAYP